MPQLMKKDSSPSPSQNSQPAQQTDPIQVLTQLVSGLAQIQKTTLNPYQEGVAKGLKKAGEQHAIDALQQEVPSDHIVQQAGLNQADILGQQAAQISKPTTNPAMAILKNIVGLGPDFQQSQLNTIGKAQTIAGQQPIQPNEVAGIEQTKAQTKVLNQLMTGEAPIQPKDILDLDRQTYSAMIQTSNEAWQRNNEEIAKMQEQYKTLQEGRSQFGKMFGNQTGEMKNLSTLIIQKMKQNQTHILNMQNLLNNPPKPANNNSPFKVGEQYNGETIKKVIKIK